MLRKYYQDFKEFSNALNISLIECVVDATVLIKLNYLASVVGSHGSQAVQEQVKVKSDEGTWMQT